MKRMRGRTHRHGSGGGGGGGQQYRHGGNPPMNRNHVFDSNGPDVRLRGTAQQLFEKYLQLGRDATGAGDRVMAESYFQHAEHYFRILNAMNQAQQQQQQHHQRRHGHSQTAAAEAEAGDGTGEQPELNGQPNGHATAIEAESPEAEQPEPREQG